MNLAFCMSAPKDAQDIPEKFRKNIVRIAVVEWIPFLDVNETETAVNICGPMARVLYDLSTTLAFNFTLNVPKALDDRSQGELDPKTGNASGVLGMILRSESDMSGVPLAAEEHTFEVVRFSDPIIMDHFTILAPRVVAAQASFFTYLMAFDWIVWTLILVSLFVLTLTDIVLSSIAKSRSAESARRKSLLARQSRQVVPLDTATPFERMRRRRTTLPANAKLPKVRVNAPFKRRKQGKMSKCTAKYIMYHRILFNQSVPNLPKRDHSRILVIIWWLSIMTFGSCFSGNLLASLLKDTPTKQLDTVADLIAHPKIKTMAVKGGPFNHPGEEFDFDYDSTPDVIFTSSDNITSKETVDKVIAGTHALVINSLSIEAIVSKRGACHFNIGSEKLMPSPLGLVMSKETVHLDFYRAINWRLRDLYQSGILGHWLRETSDSSSRDADCAIAEEQRSVRPLHWRDIQGVVVLFFIGIALSMVTIAIELTTVKRPELFIGPLVDQMQEHKRHLWNTLRAVLALVGVKLAKEVKRRKSQGMHRLRSMSMSASQAPVHWAQASSHSAQLRRRMTIVGMSEVLSERASRRNSVISARSESISSCSDIEEDPEPSNNNVKNRSASNATLPRSGETSTQLPRRDSSVTLTAAEVHLKRFA